MSEIVDRLTPELAAPVQRVLRRHQRARGLGDRPADRPRACRGAASRCSSSPTCTTSRTASTPAAWPTALFLRAEGRPDGRAHLPAGRGRAAADQLRRGPLPAHLRSEPRGRGGPGAHGWKAVACARRHPRPRARRHRRRGSRERRASAHGRPPPRPREPPHRPGRAPAQVAAGGLRPAGPRATSRGRRPDRGGNGSTRAAAAPIPGSRAALAVSRTRRGRCPSGAQAVRAAERRSRRVPDEDLEPPRAGRLRAAGRARAERGRREFPRESPL